MIEVKHLTKEFQVNVQVIKGLDDVSFKVRPGEIYGVIGLSGAGKSTLVRCLNRLEEPTRGEIFIDGQPILKLAGPDLRAARQNMSMIFQHFNLFMQKTVAENIRYPMEIMGQAKEEMAARVDELLTLIGLEAKKNAYPKQLSGGEKQRVAIARAIATNPKILLSDEGTSALDPQNTAEILKLLRLIVEKYNMTVIMITHQMEVAKNICDRIAVMERGRIVEENTTKQIFTNPQHAITKAFIKNLEDEVEMQELKTAPTNHNFYRLTYGEGNYYDTTLSDTIKKFAIAVNILSGNINKVTDSCVGHLNIELRGSEEEIAKAVAYLEANNVQVKEV